MASYHADFLSARERTHGKEAMASRLVEFIAAHGRTTTWADFDAAMDECAVDEEVDKAADKERKRQKAIKKRESHHRKKEEAARHAEECSAEIQARWACTNKADEENDDIWLACSDASM
ncbi:hypothetical protein D1007_57177 [Hordeum vulgare]|nr:hypothetical protein D1007_57177 [Hordeum vulgare]